MGIFEIIGELINPGSIGKMDFIDNEHKVRQKFIPIRFTISLIIITIFEYLLVFQTDYYSDFIYILKVNSFLVVYLLIAYIIRIKPDYDNLGWIPFLINNPFRFSDNINRFLVILNVLFMPGKYISKSIVGFYKYCKRYTDS